MKTTGLWMVIIRCPFTRVRNLRSDDRGSVLLLTAMMAFLVTIFAIVSLNTSEAIHRRITAQNAADAAADAAALWQARGCNLLQYLNNLHYAIDSALAFVEMTQYAACIGAGVARVLAFFSFGAAEAAVSPLCAWCNLAPNVDRVQPTAKDSILLIQAGIDTAIPLVVLYAANVAAKESKADPLAEVVKQYSLDSLKQLSKLGAPDVLQKLGLSGGSLDELKKDANNSSWLKEIPIFAYPLDTTQGWLPPANLSLHVERTEGKGYPWEFAQGSDVAGQVMLAGALVGAALAIPHCNPFLEYVVDVGQVEQIADTLSDDANELKGVEISLNYGWGGASEKEYYYWGNPGYMTWIAGKVGRSEVTGLGFLRWLKGGSPPKGAADLPMYTGPIASSDHLAIPAFIALASSQVEGDPVIAKGKANAEGKLIRVFLKWFDKNEVPLILH